METAHALPKPRNARPGSTSDQPPGADADRPVQRLARATGLLYLVLAVFGMFSPMVLESLVVPGDAQATADSILGSRWLFGSSLVTWLAIVIADVAISVTFYLLLRPVSHALSLLAAALRLVYSAVLAAVVLHLFDAFRLLTGAQGAAGLGEQQRQATALAALDTFSAGFLLALVLFGVHLLTLGYLLYRSRYLPRVLGALLVAAGVGYVVDSLAGLLVADHGGLVRVVLLTPAVAGELGLTAWLLLRGVRMPRPVTRRAG
ncbi:MAG TPA: DUF4386 domain-containing protein [Actinomycetota bacterium]|jgi:hypothetical protein|nr:DUF4386 domain-containing protein [Actinomycetota bacterium]